MLYLGSALSSGSAMPASSPSLETRIFILLRSEGLNDVVERVCCWSLGAAATSDATVLVDENAFAAVLVDAATSVEPAGQGVESVYRLGGKA